MATSNFLPPPIRKSNFLLRMCLLGTIYSVLAISCHKDDVNPQALADVDARYATYHKLRSFMERTEGKQPTRPSLLPRSGFDVVDVVDYIEGTLNLVYADAALSWEDYERTTDTFSLTMVGGYADEEDVIDIFEQARDSASLFFHNISEPDKFPKLFDVVILLSTTSQVDISVMAMIGVVRKDLTPFGELDFWEIFQDAGTCDENDSGPNASDVMTDAINAYYLPYGCHFYTGQEEISSLDPSPFPSIEGWGEDNPNDVTGDGILDFRTFKTICDHTTSQCLEFADTGAFCLAPDEMNFYFGSILSIYADYSEEIELDHMMADIELLELNIENNQVKTWECNDFWGNLEYCDVGNEYPYLLPFCCN